MSKGMYYTPKEIIDPAVGTGAYLKNAADMLVSNPPYSAEHRVQRTLRLQAFWQSIVTWAKRQ